MKHYTLGLNAHFLIFFRSPLANVVEDKCPAKPKLLKRKLLGTDFQSNNDEHLKLIKDMGINIVSLSDGRVQLLHTFANVNLSNLFNSFLEPFGLILLFG